MVLLLMFYSPGHPTLKHLTLVSRDSTASRVTLGFLQRRWDGGAERDGEARVSRYCFPLALRYQHVLL